VFVGIEKPSKGGRVVQGWNPEPAVCAAAYWGSCRQFAHWVMPASLVHMSNAFHGVPFPPDAVYLM
jgi:hypothetical protein